MANILERVLTEPLQEFTERVIRFLPNLLSAAFILVLGIIAGRIVYALLTRVFSFFRLDELAERSGIDRLVASGGVREPLSLLAAGAAGWLTFLFFAVVSLESLQVRAVEMLLQKLFYYLPNVFVAVVIVLLGYSLSAFLGRAALLAAVNAGLKVARPAGQVVQGVVLLFTFAVALEQLGIGKETALIAFSVLFGGVVLALSIAFGLGGRDAAKAYIEKKLSGEREEDTIEHL